MVLINYSGREINAKIVYYGPGLSGKTTNLECIYASVPRDSRGKMVSMKTRQDRTLFFDFLPLELGEIHGFRTRFLLYTVPGQVFYNATRKLVLKGADAVVFVADSTLGKLEENLQSLRNLEENLRENSLSLDSIPWVIQYNKRDLPQVHTIDEMQRMLNPRGTPCFEAAAAAGQGVYETLHAVSRLLFQRLHVELGRHANLSGAKAAAEARAVAPEPSLPSPAPASVATPMAPPAMAPASAPVAVATPPAPAGRGGYAHPVASAVGLQPEAQPRPAPYAGPEPGTYPVGGAGEAVEYSDYGHVVDLPTTREEPEEFIRDPQRRRQAGGDAGGASNRAESGLPGRTLRVPIVIKQSDLKSGPYRIVVELRVEP
jgi:signal recognition particle receptor subunit beta